MSSDRVEWFWYPGFMVGVGMHFRGTYPLELAISIGPGMIFLGIGRKRQPPHTEAMG